MLKVVIITPYVRNEVTLAAVQFADWLVRSGFEVSILADSKIEQGIHPYWDKKATRLTRAKTYAAAYRATHICWFSANAPAIRWAKQVESRHRKKKTNHLFFPYFSRWSLACDELMFLADRVICLSHQIYDWLNEQRPPGPIPTERVWANLVTPAVEVPDCYGALDKSKIKLLAVLPKTTDLDLGVGAADLLDVLLHLHKNLSITVLQESSLPTKYRKRFKRLDQVYGERFSCIKTAAYYKYPHIASKHDWVYLANTRHAFGSLFCLLASSSVPTICHDVPPAGCHIQDKRGGHLLACGVSNTKVPTGLIDLSEVTSRLDEIIDGSEVELKQAQVHAKHILVSKQKSFSRFIQQEFVKRDSNH